MKIYEKKDIDSIINELKNEKVLIAPTDTVYGMLSIHDSNIYLVKNRDKNKKIVLFISNINQIKIPLSDKFKKLASQFWPGNITLIENKISYRIPKDKFLLDLLNKIGPLYCSSANVSNKPVIQHINEAKTEFAKWDNKIILLNSLCNSSIPSTIYDIDNDKIIREGIITHNEIRQKIEN